MTENLKRCPFCGSEAEFNSDEFGEGVCCKSCGATLRNGVYGEEGRKLASDDWNARPIEDELDKKNGCLIGTCHDLHDIVEEFRAECDQKDLEIKRLREALEEIKKTVEDAQDTIYPFHLALDSKDGIYILEVTKEALKGEDE